MGSLMKKRIIEQFILRVRREARKKPQNLTLTGMGRERLFLGYDWGCDTFILEKDVWKRLDIHTPILIVRKSALVKGADGYIMTFTTGNHSVAALPLLAGKFWNLGSATRETRSAILSGDVVCANVVNDRIEISQRDVPTERVTSADEWLQSAGFPLDRVIMSERNDQTLEFYRRQGQEWRIKPLAWTRQEIEYALRSSRTRINSALTYYHSAKGIHFLSYTEFHTLTTLTEEEFPILESCMRELVSVFEGNTHSFMRLQRFHGHHEIELFGVRRGTAEKSIIPKLEKLMEQIDLRGISESQALERVKEIDEEIKASLERPSLADPESNDFAETLYMHLTGEIYYTHNDLGSLAFDDRRTALPGATFRGGRPDFHPGADDRTRVLIANIEQLLSQEEVLEYANVYEVRSEEEIEAQQQELGEGCTREILFKTNRRPLCTSLIEKRLAFHKPGYGSYMLARVHAFKSLGVVLGNYRLLMWQNTQSKRLTNYFIRNRCEGEPLKDVPLRIFRRQGESGEDPQAVIALAGLLGNAAAQNLVLKKYIPETEDCRFGVGKEIFEIGYDIALKREMPTHVSLCSIRGCLGWPNLEQSEKNLKTIFTFYLTRYAQVLYRFWRKHEATLPLEKITLYFFNGFELKTREMHWGYMARREQYDSFDPFLPTHYQFAKKWKFALWSLDRQARRIDRLRTRFTEIITEIAARDIGGTQTSPSESNPTE